MGRRTMYAISELRKFLLLHRQRNASPALMPFGLPAQLQTA
jgi:hypothetical protein